MSYHVKSSSVMSVDVKAPPTKMYNFKGSQVQNNVMTVIYNQNNGVQYGFLKKDFNPNGFSSRPYLSDGGIQIITALKPQFKAKTTFNGNPLLSYIVGSGDGTGDDFTGDMAADLNLTFSSDAAAKNTYSAYSGPTVALNRSPFLGSVGKDWLLPDSELTSAMGQATSCRFTIPEDGAHRKMIEASVEIHIMNQQGNLLFVMDTEVNNDVVLVYGRGGGFQIMCLINGEEKQGVRMGTPGKFEFAIGDPKINAVVTVTEEDV